MSSEVGKPWKPKRFEFVDDWMILTIGQGCDKINKETGEYAWEPTFVIAKLREVSLSEINEMRDNKEKEK